MDLCPTQMICPRPSYFANETHWQFSNAMNSHALDHLFKLISIENRGKAVDVAHQLTQCNQMKRHLVDQILLGLLAFIEQKHHQSLVDLYAIDKSIYIVDDVGDDTFLS